MQNVCRNVQSTIASHKDITPKAEKRYEDKLVVLQCDVSSPVPSYARVQEAILREFRQQLVALRESEYTYWLDVEPEPTVDEPDLGTYYYNIPLQTYAVGFMTSAKEFHSQFHYQRDLVIHTNQAPAATIEMDREKITILFAVSKPRDPYRVAQGHIAPTTEVYRLEIEFKHLSPWLIVHQTGTLVDIIFLSNTPMQLWRSQYNMGALIGVTDKTMWMRTCSVKSAEDIANQLAINKTTLGGCNALMLRMSTEPDPALPAVVIESLRYFGSFTIYHTVINYRPKIDAFPGVPYVAEHAGINLDLVNWLLAAFHSIGYRVKYQFAGTSGREFMRIVNRFALNTEDDRRHLENALNRAYDIISHDSDKFLHLDRVLAHCLQLPPELDELITNNGRFIKRLIITPSRLLFLAPSLMHDNRILREFDPDSAISCSFQNDDLTKFNTMSCVYEFVKETVGDVLSQGVHVANRHYVFLGCSGSQLRENGCWFYARDPDGNTASDIRGWMGELEHIRNPGTYLSRMGQCFSDTTAVELSGDVDIEWKADDVEGGLDADYKPYCFSDGVGKISKQCMDEVGLFLTSWKISCSTNHGTFL